MTASPQSDAGVADVYLLPVHPWAGRFPMRSEEDLASMAESIKANGLRMPIVLGMTVLPDSDKPTLCVIDGRNRREASRIAGLVEPPTITLNGEDQTAYITDVNLQRRDLSKGQKAMLYAIGHPKQQGKSGGTSSVSEQVGVSKTRVSEARSVIEHAETLIDGVINGAMTLDVAYEHAQTTRRLAEAKKAAIAQLRVDAPDLAEKVLEDTMSISEAKAKLQERDDEAKQAFVRADDTIAQVSAAMDCIEGKQADEVAQVYLQHADLFKSTRSLSIDIDRWVLALQRLKGALDEQDE